MGKRISRRGFAKLAGATAIVAPMAGVAAAAGTQSAAQQSAAQASPAAAAAAPKYGMTAEQEERVKQAVERSERGRGSLRSHPIAYSAEPSFVFRARGKK